MELKRFSEHELDIIHEALNIAEEATADYYKISSDSWKRLRYDVKTLRSLREDEITLEAFAQLFKYSRHPEKPPQPSRVLDFYLICLQDHVILEALSRDSRLSLAALAVYILTHELVHVVRFSRFMESFDCAGRSREKEEGIVHARTYEILGRLKWADLKPVLDSYAEFREIDRLVS